MLLSDVTEEIMDRYSLLILSGEFHYDFEFHRKMKAYVRHGGKVALTVDKIIEAIDVLKSYDKGIAAFFGIDRIIEKKARNGKVSVRYEGKKYVEKDMLFTRLTASKTAEVIAYEEENHTPVIIRNHIGQGCVTILNCYYGFPEGLKPMSKKNNIDENIQNPIQVLSFIHAYYHDLFMQEQLIHVSNRKLSYAINIIDKKNISLLLTNNGSSHEKCKLSGTIGHIANIEQIMLPTIDKNQKGYYPKGENVSDEAMKLNENEWLVKAKDMLLLKVSMTDHIIENRKKRFKEKRLEHIYLTVNQNTDIKEFILLHPTFFHYFEGIKVQAEYLENRGEEFCLKESTYLNSRKLELMVDFSTIINHYPDINILNNIQEKHENAMERIEKILKKAKLYKSRKIILNLQRNAETNFTIDEAKDGIINSFEEISRISENHGMDVFIQNSITGPNGVIFKNIQELQQAVREKTNRIKFCFNVSHYLYNQQMKTAESALKEIESEGLLVSNISSDCFSQAYDSHDLINNLRFPEEFLRDYPWEDLQFICMDSEYSQWNQVMADYEKLEKTVNARRKK